MKKIFTIVLLFVLSGISYASDTTWEVMPIRTQGQYSRGEQGGRGEQWMHGAARSKSNPDIVYLSHDCDLIWKSTDGGQTWGKPLSNGLALPFGHSIEVDPVNYNRVIVVVEDLWASGTWGNFPGIYLSTDGGDNFSFVQSGDTNSDRRFEHNIAWAPSSVDGSGATTWYVSLYTGSGGYLYRSTDRGASWTQRTSLSAYADIYETQVSPSDANTVLIATDAGLRRTTDGGSTSFSSFGDLPAGAVTSVQYDPNNSSVVYAVVYGYGAYKSTNGGSNFSKMTHGTYQSTLDNARRIMISPSDSDVFYVITYSGSIRTSDGGTNYTATSVSLESDESAWLWGEYIGTESSTSYLGGFVLISATNSQNVVGAGGGAYVYYSTNGTTFYDPALFEGGNCAGNNWSIGFDPTDGNRFMVGMQDIGTYLTENDGNWFEKRPYSGVTGGMGQNTASMRPGYPNTWLSTYGNGWGDVTLRTTDAGVNWTIVDSTSTIRLRTFYHPTDANYAYSGNRISTDGGATWSTANTSGAQIIDYCPSSPNIMFAVDAGSGIVRRSTDKGVNWSLYVDESWSFSTFDGKTVPFALDYSDCSDSTPSFYTRDSSGDLAKYNGSTWSSKGLLSQVNKPMGSSYWIAIGSIKVDPSHPEVVYAKLFGFGVYPFIWRSTDYGSTWTDISYNLYRSATYGLHVSPFTGRVYSGGCSGNWMLDAPYAAGGDTSPDQFTFTDVTLQEINTYIGSWPITVLGIDTATPISVSGGWYSINSSTNWVSTAGTVVQGDLVRARGLSASTPLTTTNVTVYIGDKQDTFSITTIGDLVPPTISNPFPGTFPSGTTGGIVSVDTDETATCRYDLTPGTAYDSMVRNLTAAGNTHSTLVGSVPYSDNFNRANEDPIAGGWVQTGSAQQPLRIVSNYLRGTTNNQHNSSHYNAAIPSDMSTSLVVHTTHMSPTVRVQGAQVNITGYVLNLLTVSSAAIWRFNGDGTYTSLGSAAVAFAAGDTMTLKADGSTISGYRNGSPIAGLSFTDNTYTGGYSGAYAWTKNDLGDDWSVVGMHPLSDGNYYHYYVRCEDAYGNKNTSDYDLLVFVDANVENTIISPWPMRKIQ